MCAPVGFEFSSLKYEKKLATKRHLDNLGLSLGNDRWRQFKSNSEGMSVHAGGQRQSSPLCCLWGSTSVRWIMREHTHTHTFSQTSDLCICRVAKICQNPLVLHVIFLCLVHPLYFTSCHQQPTWWTNLNRYHQPVHFLGFWFGWIETRQLVRKKKRD